MTIREHLERIVQAYIKDRLNQDTLVTVLKKEMSNSERKSLHAVYGEIAWLREELKLEILKCPHPEESVNEPYVGRKECSSCCCHRLLVTVGDDYYNWQKWGDWEL